MSDPVVSTGVTRQHTCQCGAAVAQDECRGAFAGAIFWDTPSHEAPCGLPCLNGGISLTVYGSGEFHKDTSRCPRCHEDSDPRVLTAEERAEGDRLAAEAEQRMIESMLECDDEDYGTESEQVGDPGFAFGPPRVG
jgi:hypothetical protein